MASNNIGEGGSIAHRKLIISCAKSIIDDALEKSKFAVGYVTFDEVISMLKILVNFISILRRNAVKVESLIYDEELKKFDKLIEDVSNLFASKANYPLDSLISFIKYQKNVFSLGYSRLEQKEQLSDKKAKISDNISDFSFDSEYNFDEQLEIIKAAFRKSWIDDFNDEDVKSLRGLIAEFLSNYLFFIENYSLYLSNLSSYELYNNGVRAINKELNLFIKDDMFIYYDVVTMYKSIVGAVAILKKRLSFYEESCKQTGNLVNNGLVETYNARIKELEIFLENFVVSFDDFEFGESTEIDWKKIFLSYGKKVDFVYRNACSYVASSKELILDKQVGIGKNGSVSYRDDKGLAKNDLFVIHLDSVSKMLEDSSFGAVNGNDELGPANYIFQSDLKMLLSQIEKLWQGILVHQNEGKVYSYNDIVEILRTNVMIKGRLFGLMCSMCSLSFDSRQKQFICSLLKPEVGDLKWFFPPFEYGIDEYVKVYFLDKGNVPVGQDFILNFCKEGLEMLKRGVNCFFKEGDKKTTYLSLYNSLREKIHKYDRSEDVLYILFEKCSLEPKRSFPLYDQYDGISAYDYLEGSTLGFNSCLNLNKLLLQVFRSLYEFEMKFVVENQLNMYDNKDRAEGSKK